MAEPVACDTLAQMRRQAEPHDCSRGSQPLARLPVLQ